MFQTTADTVGSYVHYLMQSTMGSMAFTTSAMMFGQVLPSRIRRVFYASMSILSYVVLELLRTFDLIGWALCETINPNLKPPGLIKKGWSAASNRVEKDATEVVSYITYFGGLIYNAIVGDNTTDVSKDDFSSIFGDFFVNRRPESLLWLINFLYGHSRIFVTIVGSILSALLHVMTEVEEYPEGVELFENDETDEILSTKDNRMSIDNLIKKTHELYINEYGE